MQMRLNRALAYAADLSRRKADEAVLSGQVQVNGKIEVNPATSVDPDSDVLKFKGKVVRAPRELLTFAVNKPKGVLSTVSDERHRRTVMELLPALPGLFPVGRLDLDTRGLILVTNDGDLANRLMHPSFEVRKIYEIELERDLEEDEFAGIVAGRNRGGGRSAPAEFSRTGRGRYTMVLVEGAKRQIRNIFAKLRVKLKDLKRTGIGPIRLGKVPEGGYRPLSAVEIKKLTAATATRDGNA